MGENNRKKRYYVKVMNNLIKTNSSLDEPFGKRRLERAIAEKEKLLIAILEKVERLRIDLSVLKQEYDIKIGRLYLRLDEVDLEISKFKKIEDLLEKGISFSEAQKTIKEMLKKRREQIKEEYRKLNEEEKDLEDRRVISADEQEELKKLWRKLAHKYHPDLAHGNAEMMKKINKAYAAGDLETLRAIDREKSVANIEISTIEGLKAKLVTLEKSIEKANSDFEAMSKSEWSILKKNIKAAAEQKRDLFKELSKKLLTDIAKKENQLGELKKKYGQG